MIPGLGRSPEEGHDNPLQYSCLGNALDGQMCRAGRGPQEGKGHPPWPQLMGTSGLRQLEGPGILVEENQLKLLVANLSLPGLSLGQGPLNLAGGSS